MELRRRARRTARCGALVVLVSLCLAVGVPAASAASRPAAPGIVGAPVAGDRSALVRWETPHADADQARRYTVRAYRGNTLVKTATLRAKATPRTRFELRVTGLRNGERHTFTVQASTKAGSGPVSRRSQPMIPATRPDPPTITSFVVGEQTSALASWTAPRNNGGRPVNGYQVQVTSAQNGSYMTSPQRGSRSIQITALPGDVLTVRVAAMTTAGTGTWASRTLHVPVPPPGTLPTVTVLQASCALVGTYGTDDTYTARVRYQVTGGNYLVGAPGGQLTRPPGTWTTQDYDVTVLVPTGAPAGVPEKTIGSAIDPVTMQFLGSIVGPATTC